MEQPAAAAPGPAEVFGRLIDGIGEGRWHELADLYTEDAVVEMPMDPRRTRIEGREAVRQHFAAAASGWFELRAHHVIVHATTDPEVVIAEFEYEGRNRTTGTTFNVANVQVLRVRGGRIVATRDYHDHRGFAAARTADGA
jgi:ketosteroid isomerase-like protein